MTEDKELVNQEYRLQKFPGKGGWTFAEIPEIPMQKSNPFGWVRVKGTIDDFAISQYHLMPMGNGNLFLPVKAATRKKIKKQAGDIVHIRLYEDHSGIQVPAELLECLQQEPIAFQAFELLSPAQQKFEIDHIYEAKNTITRANRIVKLMDKLLIR